MSFKLLAALLASVIALPALVLGRSYPWQLALPVAIAIGLLVFSSVSTYQNLRRGGGKGPGSSDEGREP